MQVSCSLWLADSERQMHRTAISEYGNKSRQLYPKEKSLFPPLSQQLGYAQKCEALCF